MPELAMRLVYSVRYADDVIYAGELGDDTLLTFTREPPEGWSGHTGHIDAGCSTGPPTAPGSPSLRLERLRRGGERPAGRAGHGAGRDPHRALRPDELSTGD